jgi:hypothetical protein
MFCPFYKLLAAFLIIIKAAFKTKQLFLKEGEGVANL